VSKLKLVLVAACGLALGLPSSPAFAQPGFPLRPGYQPTPPGPPAFGVTGSGAFFLLGPRYQAEQRAQAAQFRSSISQLQQSQSLLQQQLNAVRQEDIDAYLLTNRTLLGRRAATFDDTRGAFPAVELPRQRALGPRPAPARR
jgi:hypothetical protein